MVEWEEETRDLYDSVCTAFNVKNGDIWYYNGVKIYSIYYNTEVEDYKLNESNISKDMLLAVLNGDRKIYAELLRWLATNKAFKAKPHLVKRACLTTEVKNSKGFKFSNGYTEENWKERSQKQQISTCLESGRFTLYVAMCKVDEQNNEAINQILKIIIPNEQELSTFKDMLALYAFEDRGGMAKPTFVMFGDRGIGKNLITEGVLGNVYPGQVSPMPPNSDNFTGYLEKKGAILDENTGKAVDQEKQYQHIKKMSGAKLVAINKKGIDNYDSISHTWYFILANEKPLHIRDEIQAPHNNQFFVIYADSDKSEMFDEYLKEHRAFALGGQSSSVVKAFLGHYIQTELFEIYCKLKKRMVVKGSRYGMSIAPTRGLKMIKGMSSNIKETLVDQLINDLFDENFINYNLSDTLSIEARFFRDRKGFLSSTLLTHMANRFSLKAEHVKKVMMQRGFLLSSNTTIRVSNAISTKERRVSGVKLDLGLMEDVVNSEVEEL